MPGTIPNTLRLRVIPSSGNKTAYQVAAASHDFSRSATQSPYCLCWMKLYTSSSEVTPKNWTFSSGCYFGVVDQRMLLLPPVLAFPWMSSLVGDRFASSTPG